MTYPAKEDVYGVLSVRWKTIGEIRACLPKTEEDDFVDAKLYVILQQLVAEGFIEERIFPNPSLAHADKREVRYCRTGKKLDTAYTSDVLTA